jgi:hypothetical protein
VNVKSVVWDNLISGLGSSFRLGMAMERVSRGLSEMVGRVIRYDTPRTEVLPAADAAMRAGRPRT